VLFREGARPPTAQVVEFIDKYREQFGGVEPICRVLGFAPSTYYAAAGREPSARARRDEWLKGEILRVWLANYQVYGARKIYRQLRREGIEVARRTVERLMRVLGIEGVVRGKRRRTTVPDLANPVPEDLLKRDFTAPAPNRRWVADFTQVGTRVADVYVAFVIDCYSRSIVGWQCAYHMRTDLVLDALEMALSSRVVHKGQLIHHSDHGSQGGFNRSSQHPDLGGVYGTAEGLDDEGYWQAGDAFAGPTAGVASGAAAEVLGVDRRGRLQRAGGVERGRVAAGWIAVVP
jgi:Transposase and inactivated derivatives